MRPADLRPGDILLYRNKGIVGNLVAWGEWNNQPGEALEYSHIGFVFDALQTAEMNPPSSHLAPLDKLDWDMIDVWRLVGEYGDVFDTDSGVRMLQSVAKARLGEKYDAGFIFRAFGVSILARLGLTKWSAAMAQRKDGKTSREVCSIWAAQILTDVVRKLVDPGFCFLADENDNELEPSDLPRSPHLRKVSA